MRELVEVVNDLDALQKDPSARLMEPNDILMRSSLIIYKWVTSIGDVKIPKDPELDIGSTTPGNYPFTKQRSYRYLGNFRTLEVQSRRNYITTATLQVQSTETTKPYDDAVMLGIRPLIF